jgi:hypothetical protein
MTDREELMSEALHKIVQWSEAYPTDIFIEPDWTAVAEVLKNGGISLDAVSGAILRDTLKKVGEIARAALNGSVDD